MDYRTATREQIRKKVYLSPRWVALRKEYLRMASYRCEGCGWRKKSKFLILHHKKPIREGGAIYSQSNLELLCRKCHFDEHGFQPWQSRKLKENQRSQWFTELKKC